MKISYKEQGLKNHMSKLVYPEFIRVNKDNEAFMNWISSALAFFVCTTVMSPNPQYTWIDLPVPDQFIECIGGSKKITLSYVDKKVIRAYR